MLVTVSVSISLTCTCQEDLDHWCSVRWEEEPPSHPPLPPLPLCSPTFTNNCRFLELLFPPSTFYNVHLTSGVTTQDSRAGCLGTLHTLFIRSWSPFVGWSVLGCTLWWKCMWLTRWVWNHRTQLLSNPFLTFNSVYYFGAPEGKQCVRTRLRTLRHEKVIFSLKHILWEAAGEFNGDKYDRHNMEEIIRRMKRLKFTTHLAPKCFMSKLVFVSEIQVAIRKSLSLTLNAMADVKKNKLLVFQTHCGV